jgi:hypothetical protein
MKITEDRLNRASTALATPPPEPVAYIHRQGNYWEASDRVLLDDEKKRGWAEEPLYVATPPPEPPTDEEIANFLQERWHRRMAEESPFGCTDYDGSRAKQASIDDTRAALERWGRA